MKQLVFATMMCVAAMSAKAQVLTSETVNNVYEEVTNNSKSDYAFNAERQGDDITAMFVYKQVKGHKGNVTLKPHRKYEYTYDENGTLESKVTYVWNESEKNWMTAGRHDYTLTYSSYRAEYSHYNNKKQQFDQPLDRMVYSLIPGDSVNYVSTYHRETPTAQFQLVSETSVMGMPNFLAEK